MDGVAAAGAYLDTPCYGVISGQSGGFQPGRRDMDAGSIPPTRIATSDWFTWITTPAPSSILIYSDTGAPIGLSRTMEINTETVKHCPLLSLAPEMRNKIYELASTSNAPEVDFFKPAPPTKALLLSCKQIWQEAKGLHKAAYRTYYGSTTFVIGHSEVTKTTCDMPCIDEDLMHMRHVALLTTAGRIRDRFAENTWLWNPFESDQQVRLERSTIQAWWHERVPAPEPRTAAQMLDFDNRSKETLMCCVLYSGKGKGGYLLTLSPNKFTRDDPRKAPAMTRSEVENLLDIELQGQGR
ncbi:hypothetical protein LTS10_009068 [Elasticomyces elasticus]|nr:hypothetical protein LTS10_009068 [Elasticomyces elasticus]